MDVLSAIGIGMGAILAGPIISSTFSGLRRMERLRKLRR